MKKFKILIAIAVAIMISTVSGCGKNSDAANASDEKVVSTLTPSANTSTTSNETESPKEYYYTMKLNSKALSNNIVGTKTEQEAYVYLPPSYYEADKNYPVVYFLHGFGENAKSFVFSSKTNLDEAFKNGAKEFILVGVNGKNKLGGSFYANSPVSGNWEDYVVNEVVPFIDENFRTLKESDSRGICGFSMGGYGAYNIALKYPDKFSALLTMSPGLLADNDLPSALETWEGDMDFKEAYAQAFSPNPDNKEMYGNIPTFSGTPEDNKVVEEWENGFGNISKKVDAYSALDKPLKAIKIIYGENDSYPWIPRGCEYLAKYLDEKKIEHSIENFPYGHTIHPQAIENYLVPFFNENLTY